jgi:hypothetical protein
VAHPFTIIECHIERIRSAIPIYGQSDCF